MKSLERARATALAKYLFDKYPDSDLLAFEDFWDIRNGYAKKNTGDGLLTFILEEISEVVEYRGTLQQAATDALIALDRAEADIRAVQLGVGKLLTEPEESEGSDKTAMDKVWPEIILKGRES